MVIVHLSQDAWLALRIAIVLIILTGCAATEPRIAKLPEPPVITRPALPTDRIDTTTPPGEVVQLHREAILVLIAYAKELEAIIDSYRRK